MSSPSSSHHRNHRTLHVSNVSQKPSARRRRALFWTLLTVLVLALLVTAGHFAYVAVCRSVGQNDLFALRRIDVVSTGILTYDDILSDAAISTNMNIWKIDAAAVRERLENNPLVASATVSRQLPDALRIDIVERVPEVRLETTGGGTALAIARDGHVMGPSSVRPSLPKISGLTDPALSPGDVVTDVLFPDLIAIIDLCRSPDLQNQVVPTTLDISDRTRIRVLLQSGEELLLSLTDYEDKLRKFPLMRSVARDRGLTLRSYDLTVDKNFPATP